MRRRRLLALVGLGGSVPSATLAQSSTGVGVRRIGLLFAQSREYQSSLGGEEILIQSLRELGYVEGRNLLIERRYADGHYERLPAMAAELVAARMEVIVASPSPAIRAARDATRTIPIVFPGTGDPVGSGFVASLASPGGNLTGLSNGNVLLAPKMVEQLKALVPRLNRLAVLVNPGSSSEGGTLAQVRAGAQTLGIQVAVHEAASAEAIDRVFAGLRAGDADALFVAADAVMQMQSAHIAELALRSRLPSISQNRSYAASGGLASYGREPGWNFRRAAGYVDRILRGAKPADLPVEEPTRFHFAINLRTARALGLSIPGAVRLRADEVIE